GKKEEFKEILAILRRQNPDRIRVLSNLSCTEQKIITVQFHFSSSQPRKIQESATQNRVPMRT
ncbi:hypothetical protein FEC49_17360, partial [Acinetobacter baumannii]